MTVKGEYGNDINRSTVNQINERFSQFQKEGDHT